MADLTLARVRENAERIRAEIGAGVELLAAVKYLDAEQLPVLAEAGVTLLGENRAQELERKAAAHPGAFTWDFIGHLQSRKVKQVLPHVRLIHSVASNSVLEQLGKHAPAGTEVLVEVNIARDPGKSGVDPGELDAFLARVPENVRVSGLMTMPPLAERPEDNRRWFAALAQLAADRGLERLSMGTSQDYAVAAQEGATIVRIGTTLYR
ncbi:MAG TPA: YggS family pyridoxal phosphate enzyme [Solirubrobacteraceae bacterium]